MHKAPIQGRSAPAFWERRGFLSWLLWPLSKVVGLFVASKNALRDLGIGVGKPFSVPIIIVGNLRVGGTGKTPIVIALAERLRARGFYPGIISRGYGGRSHSKQSNPIEVSSKSDPVVVGDEPVLMAQRTQDAIPIWVCPERRKSIRALLNANPEVNIIISDDGLQHQDLIRWPAREGGRDIEIIVRDHRGEGNGFLLPAGPLREPADRDRDITLVTGSSQGADSPTDVADGLHYIADRPAFTLAPTLAFAYPLHEPSQAISLEILLAQNSSAPITAIAAIGNPQRFFDGIQSHLPYPAAPLKGIALPDHGQIDVALLNTLDAKCILITEKDAVKCAHIDDQRIWVVPMQLTLPNALMNWVESILQRPDPNAMHSEPRGKKDG
ncbi:tetraacyldisaccharide 4'-kinase [Polynucleobacter sp.]|uniref:tetraacyldisaccharide 4'-kinase n=1 Tax=Polynucleobacter sp. TaxID=2029855 RepID=UPI002732D115|nr:tetraacyldisaccharide 4'-kinase [Polynucleobacter sp.]MDP3122671.1 tetraacyldisaccharide 4'-kinase [Polynucleobacter sp.]